MPIDIQNSLNFIDASIFSVTILALYVGLCFSVLTIFKGKDVLRVSLIVSFAALHLLAKIYFLFRGPLIA